MSLSRTLRYSEWTRPIWWLIALPTSLIMWAAVGAVWITSRVRLTGAGANYSGPAIYVNWHRHLPLTMFVHGRSRRWMMMLGAPYMAPIAAWSRLMGLRLIRGATGSGGREALARLEAPLSRGKSIVLAVDGPAGPAFRVKPGCVQLALSSGVPVIPVAYRSRRQVAVTSRWDRMLYVLPFDEITVEFGAPVRLAADVPLDDALRQVGDALLALDPGVRASDA